MPADPGLPGTPNPSNEAMLAAAMGLGAVGGPAGGRTLGAGGGADCGAGVSSSDMSEYAGLAGPALGFGLLLRARGELTLALAPTPSGRGFGRIPLCGCIGREAGMAPWALGGPVAPFGAGDRTPAGTGDETGELR